MVPGRPGPGPKEPCRDHSPRLLQVRGQSEGLTGLLSDQFAPIQENLAQNPVDSRSEGAGQETYAPGLHRTVPGPECEAAA